MAKVTTVGSSALVRREYKYLIDEDTAARVRHFIDGVCAPDRYASTSQGRYRCDTLYFDSLHMNLYRATIEREPVRHKLRIRGYPDAPDAPVFLEVKRRILDVVKKTRAPVFNDWAQFLDDGGLIDRVAVRDRAAAENFVSYYQGSFAGPLVPTVLVRYEREPYFSLVDDYARVTFDRKLSYRPTADLSMASRADDSWTPVDDPVSMRVSPSQSLIVLELKFGELVPSWMRRMVQSLELRRDAFCKYSRAVDSLLARPTLRTARSGLRA